MKYLVLFTGICIAAIVAIQAVSIPIGVVVVLTCGAIAALAAFVVDRATETFERVQIAMTHTPKWAELEAHARDQAQLNRATPEVLDYMKMREIGLLIADGAEDEDSNIGIMTPVGIIQGKEGYAFAVSYLSSDCDNLRMKPSSLYNDTKFRVWADGMIELAIDRGWAREPQPRDKNGRRHGPILWNTVIDPRRGSTHGRHAALRWIHSGDLWSDEGSEQ